MGINLDQLRLTPVPLKRGHHFVCLGGEDPLNLYNHGRFLGGQGPSSYNAILGHPTLNSLRPVTSTYHLKMKFPTNLGVGKVRDEQVIALECYAQELRHEVKVAATVGEA